MRSKERQLSPPKSGLIYGSFTPSPLGSVTVVKDNGYRFKYPANREERRRLVREERRRQKHEGLKGKKETNNS